MNPLTAKKISYTLAQYTIDCGKQTYKIGVIDSYDNQGISYQEIITDLLNSSR